MVSLVLTCDLQRGVPAEGGPLHIAGQTAVDPTVHLLLAVDGPQEEEAAVRQDDPVGGRICWSCLHQLPVFVPINYRLRVPSRLGQKRTGFRYHLYINTCNT